MCTSHSESTRSGTKLYKRQYGAGGSGKSADEGAGLYNYRSTADNGEIHRQYDSGLSDTADNDGVAFDFGSSSNDDTGKYSLKYDSQDSSVRSGASGESGTVDDGSLPPHNTQTYNSDQQYDETQSESLYGLSNSYSDTAVYSRGDDFPLISDDNYQTYDFSPSSGLSNVGFPRTYDDDKYPSYNMHPSSDGLSGVGSPQTYDDDKYLPYNMYPSSDGLSGEDYSDTAANSGGDDSPETYDSNYQTYDHYYQIYDDDDKYSSYNMDPSSDRLSGVGSPQTYDDDKYLPYGLSGEDYSDTAANSGGDDSSQTYGDYQSYDGISSASGEDSSKGFSQDSDAGLGNRGIVNNVLKSVDGVADTIGL
ncbi:hypothetical protein MBANPS3_002044 [Mucor bainieri]